MNPREVNIEKIEAYCQDTMLPTERAVFEKDIANDAELAKEVEAYRKIFSGLNVLADVSFEEQLGEWSAEWSAADGEETMLIEAYVNEHLHTELKQQVEKRLKTDTEFAKKVAQYQTLFSGLNAVADEEFKHKLEGWEKDNKSLSVPAGIKTKEKIRTLYGRLAVAASLLLVVSMGLKWYASANFGSGALVEEAYFKPETGGVMGSEVPKIQEVVAEEFAIAHKAMENREYGKAIESFDNVLLSLELVAGMSKARINSYKDNARFSKALALLAEEGDFQEVKEILLELIETTEDDFYKSKAEILLKKMDSLWFKIR